MTQRRIALSGAQGFIGAHLKAQLRDLGHIVVPLARTQPKNESEWIPYSLEKAACSTHLRGFDTLIHAAYDFTATDASTSWARNVEGSIDLFKAAKEAKISNLIFISTLSAFPGCKSIYGKGKLEVERQVSDLGGKSARLGFVYDGTERGLSGSLMKLVSTLPVVPLPGSGRQRVYPMAAASLANALLAVIENAPNGSVISLAQLEPMTFANLLRLFAHKKGKSVALVPVPWQCMWLALRAGELLGARLNFRSDSLLSLVNQNPNPDFQSLRMLGITVRPLMATH